MLGSLLKKSDLKTKGIVLIYKQLNKSYHNECGGPYIPHMAERRALSCTGNWSVNRRQFSSPTWFLNPCRILVNISFKSSFGCDHEATASQKNMKSGTTPAGLTCIIWQIPRNAESFSSLSRMFRSDAHLYEMFRFQVAFEGEGLCSKPFVNKINCFWNRSLFFVHVNITTPDCNSSE